MPAPRRGNCADSGVTARMGLITQTSSSLGGESSGSLGWEVIPEKLRSNSFCALWKNEKKKCRKVDNNLLKKERKKQEIPNKIKVENAN